MLVNNNISGAKILKKHEQIDDFYVKGHEIRPLFVPKLLISPLNRHISPLNVKIYKKTESTRKADSEFVNIALYFLKCILIRKVLAQ